MKQKDEFVCMPGWKSQLRLPLGEIMHATRMTPDDLKRELAVQLFREGKLSFGKARELAGLTVWAFQHLLGSKEIPIHYDVKEYDEDLVTLKEMGHHDAGEGEQG